MHTSIFLGGTAYDETWKKRFADYMTGKKTMPLTYDPFFKCMFHPDRHPDWLSNLLSAILGESVVVERLLPSENTAISIDSLLIMDIVVRLKRSGGESREFADDGEQNTLCCLG